MTVDGSFVIPRNVFIAPHPMRSGRPTVPTPPTQFAVIA
jgi:hypothetical protein